jgi:hypothetical protein
MEFVDEEARGRLEKAVFDYENLLLKAGDLIASTEDDIAATSASVAPYHNNDVHMRHADCSSYGYGITSSASNVQCNNPYDTVWSDAAKVTANQKSNM